MPVSASLPDAVSTAAVKETAPRHDATMPPAASDAPTREQIDPHSFSMRVRLLIERVGSASALAQCCGASEGTVRSWRDGRSDISRERCLVLARALDISPLWLVCGEGAMTDVPATRARSATDPAGRRGAVDSERLAAALQVLQSYVVLAGGSLNLTQRAEAAAELYSMLAQPGPSDASRLIAFHHRLGAYLRSNRPGVVA